MLKKYKKCPCQSSLKYGLCCSIYHTGSSKIPTAEALSRARHSAIIFKKSKFIYNTWDESTRPSHEEIKQEIPETQNADYEIVHTDMGLEKHDIGMITSITHYNDKKRESFKRINNEWKFYKSEKVRK